MNGISQKPLKFGILGTEKGFYYLKLEKVSEAFLSYCHLLKR
ncbi:conserved domain protein [Streptococcus sp. oral taxon 056 str. F0418]|nr:conserved domain protein [Streptococcus sp. oral taxon 056 str. F0418]